MGIDVERLMMKAGHMLTPGTVLRESERQAIEDLVRVVRAETLEEAAKVCEGVVSSDPNCVWEAAYKHVADEHAAAIRALAKGGE